MKDPLLHVAVECLDCHQEHKVYFTKIPPTKLEISCPNCGKEAPIYFSNIESWPGVLMDGIITTQFNRMQAAGELWE